MQRYHTVFLVVRALRVSNFFKTMHCGSLKGFSQHVAPNKSYPIQTISSGNQPQGLNNMPPKQFPWTSMNERIDEAVCLEHRNSHPGKSFCQLNYYFWLPWKAFFDGECISGLESELMTIFPIPASMASLSSLSFFFWSKVAASTPGL